MKAVLIAVPALFPVAGCMTTEGADSRPQGHSNGVNVVTTTPAAPAAPSTNGPRRADVYMEALVPSRPANDPFAPSDETNLTGSTSISRDNIAGTVSIPTTNPAGTVTAGDRVFNPANL
ncbi:MAG: hypothetical protein VX083_18525 [Pseudomonadota bacterium]|jgi:hypothetical protein|nr:hypothetical protein [Pseudomonadota bacterium]MEC8295491.1 hypothetical protein [Pseudomonadota bacterium]